MVSAATLLAIVLLSACAGPFSWRTRDNSDNQAAQAEKDPALLLFAPQGTPERDEALRDIVTSLNQLNPSLGITVTLSANYDADLADALASKRPPDVYLVTGSMLPDLVAAGDVTPIAPEWIDQSQLLSAAAQGIQVDGKTYCFPHSVHTMALIYNADLFADAGVEPPSSDWNWENLATAAASLTISDTGTVGLVLDPTPLTWALFYLQAGGELGMQEDGSDVFSAGAGRLAADYMASLFANGIAVSPEQLETSWSGEAFATGDVGLMFAGDWMLPFLASSHLPFSYGVSELPRGPSRTGNFAFANCVAVHAQSQHEDLALQLAQQLTAPEVLGRWADTVDDALSVYIVQEVVTQPVRSSVAPFLRALRYATPWRLGNVVQQYSNRFHDGLIMVADEEMTAEEFWPYILQAGLRTTTP